MIRSFLIRHLDRLSNWADQKTEELGGVAHARATHEATISAVVTRADGTVEDHGVVTRATITKGGDEVLKEGN